jgi:hypothetical protein
MRLKPLTPAELARVLEQVLAGPVATMTERRARIVITPHQQTKHSALRMYDAFPPDREN